MPRRRRAAAPPRHPYCHPSHMGGGQSFSQKAIFFCVHFLEGNGLFGEVVAGKIDFSYNFCRFLPILSHFYFFGAFSFCIVGAFLAIFPIFLGFVWDFLGDPRDLFRRFWQFWPFLTTFGPFLDHFWAEKKIVFFCRKMAFWPRNKRRILEC